MLPELLNRAFSTKSHNVYMYIENGIGSLMTPEFQRKARYVAVRVVIEADTHTHKTITVTLMHALTVNNSIIMVYLVTEFIAYIVC